MSFGRHLTAVDGPVLFGGPVFSDHPTEMTERFMALQEAGESYGALYET